MLITAYNPEYYIKPYSEYNLTQSGLKIELLYRKVGTQIWYKALNSTGKQTLMLDIKKNMIVPVSSADRNYDCVYLIFVIGNIFIIFIYSLIIFIYFLIRVTNR